MNNFFQNQGVEKKMTVIFRGENEKMRRLNLFLVFGALLFTVLTIVFEWPLFQELASFLADSTGRYKVMHLWGLLFLIYLSPAILLLVFLLLFKGRTPKVHHEILDSDMTSGIVVKRARNLYGALFPMDIYVDGVKKATIIAGKKVEISLNPGTYQIKVIAMQHFSPEITVVVSDTKMPLTCGFELAGTLQNVYIVEG